MAFAQAPSFDVGNPVVCTHLGQLLTAVDLPTVFTFPSLSSLVPVHLEGPGLSPQFPEARQPSEAKLCWLGRGRE